MCPALMLARASLLLCLVIGSRQLSITELVVPSTVRSGESVDLACQYDRGAVPEDVLIVKWWWKSINSSVDKLQIYQRIGMDPGVAMHHDIRTKGNDTIVLSEVDPSDSGSYECEVYSDLDADSEERQHQELTVFTPGTGPLLNVSVVADGPDEDTEEDVLIECRADGVAPAPDILLKINGEKFNATEEILGPNAEGYYDAVVTATQTKDAVEGATITCELFYTDLGIMHEPYIATQQYTSGALTTTEVPEESTEPIITPDSLQKQSDDSTVSRASWALLFALGLLTQVPSLL